MLEFRLGQTSEMLRKRVENAFRLVGWSCEMETAGNWLEVCPESVLAPDFAGRMNLPATSSDHHLTFERHRSEKPSPLYGSDPRELFGPD